MVCKPNVVRVSTKVVTPTTSTAHRNGVNAVSPCHENKGSVGLNRFSPKIWLNGSCTGVWIGWLLAMVTASPASRKKVPRVVIREGTWNFTVITTLTKHTTTPTSAATTALMVRGT